MSVIKQFFTDDSGKYSSGRMLMFIVTITYLVLAVKGYNGGVLPDMPQNVALLVGGIYGMNKFSPTKPFGEDK